jgi:hypothetical protein
MTDQPRGHFIGIANGHYPNYPDGAGRALPQAVDDLRTIATRFEATGYDTVLIDNQDRDGILAALTQHLLDRVFDREARVVLWYSGHGLTTPRFQLAGVRHQPANPLSGDLVDADTLLRAFHDNDTLAKLLIVLDCCFAGTATQDMLTRR